MKKTLKGFTLIEMLIVIVIIGILAAVLLPKIGGARDKANDVAVTATVKNLGTAIIQYEMDNREYPDDLDTFRDNSALMEKYGVNEPSDTGNYTYVTTGHKFIVCGKYSDNNSAGNLQDGAQATLDTITSLPKDRDTTGQYFCYQS